MKYSVKPVPAGHATEPSWAVWQGNRKYFVNTVTTDKAQAEKDAKIWSMQWHYEQAEKIGEAMVEEYEEVENWRDYLC